MPFGSLSLFGFTKPETHGYKAMGGAITKSTENLLKEGLEVNALPNRHSPIVRSAN